MTARSVEDNAAVLMSFPGGAIATATISYVTRSNPFVLEVHGSQGSILYSEPGIGVRVHDRQHPRADDLRSTEDLPRLRLWTAEKGPTRWQELVVEPDAPTAFERWVSLAEARRPDDDNVALALRLTRIVESAYKSAREGS